MNNDTKQNTEELVRQLEANPQMLEPIKALLTLVEDEKSLGRTADQIEQTVIEQVRALGRASVQGWAVRASAAARPQGKAHKHAKKNSGG